MNEMQLMQMLKDGASSADFDGYIIVTENDMEIYHDDYVFRVHIERCIV